jgi:hypothetical protein
MTIAASASVICQADFGALSRIGVILAMVLARVVALPLQGPQRTVSQAFSRLATTSQLIMLSSTA